MGPAPPFEPSSSGGACPLRPGLEISPGQPLVAEANYCAPPVIVGPSASPPSRVRLCCRVGSASANAPPVPAGTRVRFHVHVLLFCQDMPTLAALPEFTGQMRGLSWPVPGTYCMLMSCCFVRTCQPKGLKRICRSSPLGSQHQCCTAGIWESTPPMSGGGTKRRPTGCVLWVVRRVQVKAKLDVAMSIRGC